MAAYEVNVEEVEPMSRTYQYRKVMKPMLERKRRARINKCLDELKDLMVGALQNEGESITKLEKADVLELTVKHLKKLKQHHALAIPAHNHATEKFRAGFGHCATEVRRFVEAVPGVDMHISGRLFNHLGQWMAEMDKMPSSAMAVGAPSPSQRTISPTTTVSCSTVVPIPRVYTPPASPEAKMAVYQVQPTPSPTVKAQPISPTQQQYFHAPRGVLVVSPIHHQYNSGTLSESLPRQTHSVIVSTPPLSQRMSHPEAPTTPPSPALMQEPLNYCSLKCSPPTGIKIEVPLLSPVWRPW